MCTGPVFFPDPSTSVLPEVKPDDLASVYSAPMRPWEQLYQKCRNLSRVERHLERRTALPSCQKQPSFRTNPEVATASVTWQCLCTLGFRSNGQGHAPSGNSQKQGTAGEPTVIRESFVAVFPIKHSAKKRMQEFQEAAVHPSLIESMPGTQP